VSTDDTVYVLATDSVQASKLFDLYRNVADNETALQMLRSGMISPAEAEAHEHRARAGRGLVFAVTYKVVACPPNRPPESEQEHTMATQEIPARELVVGDIIEQDYRTWKDRRIVINITKTSAVTISSIGTSGRVQLTRKVKGEPKDVSVTKIGHRDLRRQEIDGLKNYVSMGDYNRAMFRHGRYYDLPRFEILFGYAEGEGPSGYGDDGELVRTITSTEFPEGDKVEISRWMRPDYSTKERPAPEKAMYGARVIEGEHGIMIGYVRANLASEEAAEQAADFYLGKRYFDGWSVEQALGQAQYLADILPTA
jgi:hypothetical protein